jgi:urease accessory protein
MPSMPLLSSRSSKIAIFLVATILLSTGAEAHLLPSNSAHQESALLAGFWHPLTGLDHLAAMLAVGMWSALVDRSLWRAPATFATMLLLGAMLAWSGVNLPAVEPMIAVSLLAMGLLVSGRQRLPAVGASLMVGVFAMFHGAAHGTELSHTGAAWSALLGMVLGTAALHAAGVGLGLQLRQRSIWWPRLTGALVALLGGGMLMSMT